MSLKFAIINVGNEESGDIIQIVALSDPPVEGYHKTLITVHNDSCRDALANGILSMLNNFGLPESDMPLQSQDAKR